MPRAQCAEDDSVVVVELEPSAVADGEFLVLGTGTNNMAPGITCTCEPHPSFRRVALPIKHHLDAAPLLARRGNEAPPPSPPHPSDCLIGPHYHTFNTWGGGEEAEVRPAARR